MIIIFINYKIKLLEVYISRVYSYVKPKKIKFD
jgi:hypothetical protein